MHLLVAAYLGIKPKDSASSKAEPTQDELSTFGNAVHPPPIFTSAADYLKQRESNGQQ